MVNGIVGHQQRIQRLLAAPDAAGHDDQRRFCICVTGPGDVQRRQSKQQLIRRGQSGVAISDFRYGFGQLALFIARPLVPVDGL